MDQFNKHPQQSVPQTQDLQNKLNEIKAMAGGNAFGLIMYMMQASPKFAEFANWIRGKTPEQAFAECGLDYSQFKGFL